MPSEELRFFIIFAAKFTKFMEIKELYKLYQQHPCITTDSRDCPQGSIFLALKGELFDGNKFAASAIEKGCAYAIVDDASVVPASDNRFIVVQDCLQTFKDLAREHRRQFNIPVIGITGTNGKTTTKELIAAVLSQKYNVLYTQGNFNNDVGVPKTLFRLSNEHEIAVIEMGKDQAVLEENREIAVIEMGASHPGDIKTLAETAEPTCGLITNVGKAHLQGFGSFETEPVALRERGGQAHAQRGGVGLRALEHGAVDVVPDLEDAGAVDHRLDPLHAGDGLQLGEVGGRGADGIVAAGEVGGGVGQQDVAGHGGNAAADLPAEPAGDRDSYDDNKERDGYRHDSHPFPDTQTCGDEAFRLHPITRYGRARPPDATSGRPP